MSNYIIRVMVDGEARFVFNTRSLLTDIALAKPFSSVILANRYFKKTQFTHLSHTVIAIEKPENEVDYPTLGSIVE